MTLKRKKKFFRHNWFWCRLHGIDYEHLHLIDGSFVRYTNKCAVSHCSLRNVLSVDLRKFN